MKNPGPASPPQDPDISAGCIITPLTDRDVEEAAALYTTTFLDDEPTSVRIAPDRNRFTAHAREYVRALVSHGISFVARDRETDELCGYIFAFDITDDFGKDGNALSTILADFREAVVMIDELERRHLPIDGMASGTILHAFQGGVGRNFRKKGIFKALVCRMIRDARACGYRQIIGDCTNPISENGLAALGFHKTGFSSYDSFVLDGTHFFAGLSGGITLMVKEL